MSSKSRIKVFQRAMARYGMRSFIWLFEMMPYFLIRPFSNLVLAIGYQFIIKQRQIAQESLQIAFGKEKSPEEIQEITKTCFSHVGQNMTDLFYFMSHPTKVKDKVYFEGIEHLDNVLKEGKGVIVVTAHFGNFPLMMLAFAQAGYKVNSMIRPARDKSLEEYIVRRRREVGVDTIYAIPRRQCVSQSLKVLRNNEMLFILADQNFGSEGRIYVDFFGQKAATATGPVVFARRTQSPLLPMFSVQQPDGRHKIIIEPPIVIEENEGESEEVITVRAMEKVTHLIEKYIRQYPPEWAWMHRRWKSRPVEEKGE